MRPGPRHGWRGPAARPVWISDRPGRFGASNYRGDDGVQTCGILVPYRRVEVIARSHDGKWGGETTAGPNTDSVEIRLSPR